jgi:toxin-antitoxin system PIN domain toxin
MLIPDINILILSHRPDEPNGTSITDWLSRQLLNDEPVGLADAVWSGFLRICTNPRIYSDPSPIAIALAFLDDVFSAPATMRVHPGRRHYQIFTELCRTANVRGDRVPDAYLAALAIETGATFITMDRDFGRYPGLKWRHPLEP